ncbi:hypothetical protein K461DRAFT_243834 [Myriangium duriaei CBS 260.36]|uniref:Ubiquitin-like 1-activating enzyme E1A n=1 Tax=Myriangium duriaei CBS 260.36 TaxID=1168546 RepID=A0A9P4IYQ8_9PEZI|nr:hypothetical protein K461DRAFT_243834 [Myriangium duriaei CBS 260.36]
MASDTDPLNGGVMPAAPGAVPNIVADGAGVIDGPPSILSTDAAAVGISADEIALYDRQIRLWGVQAQERIRSANVLLITIKAVGTEIAKNLILNGIGSLTIVDNGAVNESDLGAQYFLRDQDLGANRAQAAAPRLQELNPRVTVHANPGDPSQFTEQFYKQYDMIIATDLPFILTAMINAATRMAGRPFYAAGIHGLYGYVFADLIAHEYIIERERSNITTVAKAESSTRAITGVTTKKENGKNIELVTKRENYSPLLLANSSPLSSEYLKNRRRLKNVSPLLPALRALWEFERKTGHFPGHSKEDLILFTTMANEKLGELQLPPDILKADFMRSFLQSVGSEIVPTAAFVGGRLSEDAINVLGKREQPIQNFMLFDGDGFQAPIYALHPFFDEQPVVANGVAAAIPLLTSPPVGAGLGGIPAPGVGMQDGTAGVAAAFNAPVLDEQATLNAQSAPAQGLDAPGAGPRPVSGPGDAAVGRVNNSISDEPQQA